MWASSVVLLLCLVAVASVQGQRGPASFGGSGDRPQDVDKDAKKECQVIEIRYGSALHERREVFRTEKVEENNIVDYQCDEGYTLIGRRSLRCLRETEAFDFPAPRCDPISCPNPGVPLNGARIGDVFTYGSSVTFSCDAGYTLRGSIRRICRAEGSFSGSPVTCRPVDCGDPGTPVNGGRALNPNTLYPSTVSFTCDRGYNLQGANAAVCQPDATWSEPVPKCQLVACCELEAPRNGAKVGQGTAFDQVIGFTCDSGYELVGPESRTCQADGSWTGKPVRCEPIMCPVPKTIDNGGYTAAALNVGSVVSFYCDNGYHLAGDMRLTCLPTGKWDKPLPACVVVDCGNPATPENGAREGDNFEFRSSVSFTCNRGYRLLGSPVRFCQADGSWTGTPPMCNLISCGDPGTPTNGAKAATGTAVEDTVKWTCDVGYRMIGRDAAECMPNGAWSMPTPICERIMCNDPGTPQFGSRTGDTIFSTGAGVGLACNRGYELLGEPQLECMTTGSWNFPIPLCEEMVCSDPGTPDNGMRVVQGFALDETVKYACNPGYRRVGPEELMCVLRDLVSDVPASLQWDRPAPTCEKIVCENPGIPANGGRQGNDFSFLSTVSYTCDEGYVLEGTPGAVCLADKSWSNPLPRCRPVRCPDPGQLTNGVRRLSGSMYQDTVMWSCDLSYVVVGSPSARCQADGTWSMPKPTCVLAECRDPGMPDNGGRRMTSASVGSRVEYFCNDGYTLSGPRVRTCLPTREWSVVPPVCNVVMCADPLAPVNGGRTGNDFSYAMSVRFHCNEGYRLVGSPVVICFANGSWSDPTPTCRVIDCGDPGRVVNGRRALTSTEYGSQVGFSCDSGYVILGESSARCLLNGQWSSAPPQCVRRQCPDPGTPNFGSRTLEGLRFRDDVSWMCNTGYVMRGQPAAVCQANGQWSNPLPSCRPIECNDPGTPTFGSRTLQGLIYQNRVDWTCNAGYNLVGSPAAICQADRSWTSPVPTCEPVDCGDPGRPVNGGRSMSGTLLGDRVTYSCNSGYRMDGELEAVCLPSGSWGTPPPRCIIIECPDISPPLNGNRLIASRIVGSEVTFTCDAGYTLVGDTSVLCQANGRWSDPPPICQIVECGPPPPFENGVIDYSLTSYKSQARYKCDTGYNLVGANVRDCFATGVWNPEAPLCVKISCGNPGMPANGGRRGNDFSYEARVTFTCDTNFQMNGPASAVCQADGKWSNPLPSCDPDCRVGEFGPFGPCSVTCGNGTQVQTRAVLQAPSGLGFLCPDLRRFQGCNPRPCIQCEDKYPEGAIKYQLTQVDVSASTRIVVVVDESNSMAGEHAWLPEMMRGLEANLLRLGIGKDPQQPNTYSLCGYGRRSPNYTNTFLRDNRGRNVFPNANFDEAATRLFADPEGRIEDGYEAMYNCLRELNFDVNPSIAHNLIFISDEDRDVTPEGRNITRSVMKKFLRQGSWLPNVVVDNTFQCGGSSSIGVDSNLVAYLPQGGGSYEACNTSTRVGSGYANTRRSYTNLALELKGAAWDINVLREGGSSSASFTNAFTDVKTKEIRRATEQCRRCTCSGATGVGQFVCRPDGDQDRCTCIADGGTWSDNTCTGLTEPQPCLVGQWSVWGGCSATCGVGSRTRTRAVTQRPGPRAEPCPRLTEVTTCSVRACPIDCNYPGAPANGAVSLNANQPTFAPGTAAVFTCNDGFRLEGAAQATCQSDGRFDRPLPVCLGLACSPGSVTYEVATDATGLAADVYLVIDQSRSMEGEIAWLPGFIRSLESNLISKGIGGSGSCGNLFSVTGYGRSTPNHLGEVFTDRSGANCFPANRFDEVIGQVSADASGRIEDGYEAISKSLNTVGCYRQSTCSVGRNLILISDEDRDNVDTTLDPDAISTLLLNRGFILNVVVDNTFTGSGQNALGVDSKGNAFLQGAGGRYQRTSNNVRIGQGYAGTKVQYTDLALSLKGGAWDINILRLGGGAADAFTSAIVDIKAEEILSQLSGCQECRCSVIGETNCIAASDQQECACRSNRRTWNSASRTCTVP